MSIKTRPIPERLPASDLAALQLRIVRAEARARAADATLRCLLGLLASNDASAFRLVAEGLRNFSAGLDANAADAYHRALVTELRGVIGDILKSTEPVAENPTAPAGKARLDS